MPFVFAFLPPPLLFKTSQPEVCLVSMLILGITRVSHCKPSGNVVEMVIFLNNSSLLASVSKMSSFPGWEYYKEERRVGFLSVWSFLLPDPGPIYCTNISVYFCIIRVSLEGHPCLHTALTLYSVHCSFLRKCFQRPHLVL